MLHQSCAAPAYGAAGAAIFGERILTCLAGHVRQVYWEFRGDKCMHRLHPLS